MKKKKYILLLSVLIYFTYHLEQKAAELSYMHFFQINSLKKRIGEPAGRHDTGDVSVTENVLQ